MSDTPKPFDRAVQRRILEAAQKAYPDPLDRADAELFGLESESAFNREVTYLHEHGLLEMKVASYTGFSQIRDVRINARGIDFLADDGGLSAILGVVTVRLEAETITALLAHVVSESDEDPSVKKNLLRQIKALPAEAVKALTLAGVRQALSSAPDGVRWLRSVLADWMQ